ncbi:MAG: hypothetical protein IKM43_03415 [Clostridia bacterium]|nr:hypothetical protein [Clostridia bacterium]
MEDFLDQTQYTALITIATLEFKSYASAFDEEYDSELDKLSYIFDNIVKANSTDLIFYDVVTKLYYEYNKLKQNIVALKEKIVKKHRSKLEPYFEIYFKYQKDYKIALSNLMQKINKYETIIDHQLDSCNEYLNNCDNQNIK